MPDIADFIPAKKQLLHLAISADPDRGDRLIKSPGVSLLYKADGHMESHKFL